MKKVELLAPAGNMESLYAAVMGGCDAVYLGGKSFGARAYSKNFSEEEIIQAINYCHLYGVKVYVTCNTLVYEENVEDFINYVRFLHQNGVDAILIQDLGMLDLVRKKFPKLEIHASTQMHIHNLDGVQFLEKLGVKRVVLARETNVQTIKDILSQANVEIEVFAHGSLCVSYSGQCLMSSLIGGRSGNLGCCAGSCRLSYDVVDGNGKILNKEKYPLSMKDLCTVDKVGQLIDMGVSSLKIEGRMKSPSYVYLVTKLYREAIEAWYSERKVYVNEKILKDLKKVFNREYTEGFLFNAKNSSVVNMKRPNHQGVVIGKVINYKRPYVTIKLTDDLHIQDGLRIVGKDDVGVKVNELYINKKLVKEAHKNDVVTLKIKSDVDINSDVLLTSSSYIDKVIEDKIKVSRKVLIDGVFEARLDGEMMLTLSDNLNNKVQVTISGVSKANNVETLESQVRKQLTKLGDTVYDFQSLTISLDNKVFIPMGLLNELRRKAVLELNKKRLKVGDFKEESYYIEVPDFQRKFIKCCLISKENDLKKIYENNYDVVYCKENVDGIGWQLPKVIDSYPSISKHLLVGEIGAFNKFKNVDCDVSFNVVNSYTVAFLHSIGAKKITLSYELSDEQVKKIVDNYFDRYHKRPNVEVIVYAREEVMISKFNLNDYFSKEKLLLRDNFKNDYIIKNWNGMMVIYNYKIRDKRSINYYEMGVNAVRENIM